MANYFNPYIGMSGNYMNELQNMRDRIDSQIQQVQQQQQNMNQIPMQQPTNLTQNFQLAPTTQNNNFKIVNNIDEVQKEIVLVDTYFISKDTTQMWIKNSKGDIRVFTIEEIIPKDEKDILIENLQKQIAELKGGNLNATTQFSKSNDNQLYEPANQSITTNEPADVSAISNSKTTKRKS